MPRPSSDRRSDIRLPLLWRGMCWPLTKISVTFQAPSGQTRLGLASRHGGRAVARGSAKLVRRSGIGSDSNERTVDLASIESMDDDAHLVVDVDPGGPMAPSANPAAEMPAELCNLRCDALGREHVPRSESDRPDAMVSCGERASSIAWLDRPHQSVPCGLASLRGSSRRRA